MVGKVPLTHHCEEGKLEEIGTGGSMEEAPSRS